MTLRLVHRPSTGATQLVCHYLSSAVPQLTLSSSACGDRAAPRGLVISNQMKRNVGSFRCVAKCFVRGETDKPTVNSASCVITTGHPAPHHCHPLPPPPTPTPRSRGGAILRACNLDDGGVRDEREGEGEARQECREEAAGRRVFRRISTQTERLPRICLGHVAALPLRPQSTALTCKIPATQNNKYLQGM